MERRKLKRGGKSLLRDYDVPVEALEITQQNIGARIEIISSCMARARQYMTALSSSATVTIFTPPCGTFVIVESASMRMTVECLEDGGYGTYLINTGPADEMFA